MPIRALATDYDGTIATHGTVDSDTLAALRRLRDAGGTLILVTGRELPQLKQVFPDLDLCHMVVAENGALLYTPATGKERPLCEPPEESFVRALKQRGVKPLSVGRVIVATYEPHETTVLNVIKEQGLERQVIFNKGAVMVLPSGVNKASGLTCALQELKIDPADVAGVGDAENDHALLQLCGVGAAVANALPALKDHADLVLSATHGAGVTQLIERIIDGTIDATPRRPRVQTKRETARVHRLADKHADVHPNA
ncbi:MAG: haloacid dehalogenase [Gemmatimonadetes bacterium]|nr:MAG: haloacid dehalogenase [Gemmatimonadota bacterium]